MTEDAIPARKRISNDLGDKSLGERVSLIYRSLPLILIVNILASILFAYTLSDLTPLHDLLTWLLLIAMVSALRFISYFRVVKIVCAFRGNHGKVLILHNKTSKID